MGSPDYLLLGRLALGCGFAFAGGAMSNITSVYGGRATITFHEARHYYTVRIPGVEDRLYQPSVTSVIGCLDKSNALVPWAVKCMTARVKELVGTAETVEREALLGILDAAQETWRQVKEQSADVGSLVHRVLEQELLHRAGQASKPALPVVADPLLAPGLTPLMIEQANDSISAGLRFFDEHHIEVIQAEAPRWSPTHGYIGTGDLIARVDGDLAVLDWKTGKRLYPTVFLQLAAYQKAYEEEFDNHTLTRRLAVNIGRDGTLSTEERNNDTLEADFSAFLGLLAAWRWNCENQGKYSKPAPRVLGPLPSFSETLRD